MIAMSPTDSTHRLIASLRDSIQEVLDRLLPPGTSVAHVGFPDHWNAGDPAIWLGEEALLAERGCRIVYQCSLRNYEKAAMRRLARDATIIICGGGNLGDLWPNHQLFRERILQDFPENPVLQMPQSVFFEEAPALERFQAVCAAHRNFHLLLRDRKSLSDAQRLFNAQSTLCPDSSCGLGVLTRESAPISNIMALMRADKEGDPRANIIPDFDVLRADWIEFSAHDDGLRQAAEALGTRMASLHRELPIRRDSLDDTVAEIRALGHELSWLRLRRGLRFLGRGRVLVTDRLHGHLLALALRIPHVLIDNANHKLRALFDTWTAGSALCSWAENGEIAVQKARHLLQAREN